MDENRIGEIIVTASIEIHRELGPGLLESVYEAVLAEQLPSPGLHVERQVPVEVEFRGRQLGEGFRADLLVEGRSSSN